MKSQFFALSSLLAFALANLDLALASPIERATTTTVTYPASPSGATLTQLKPCSGSGTVPAFYNGGWAPSGSVSEVTTAYISQHGAGTDFNDYFTYVQEIVGTSAAVIAPGFYETDDTTVPNSWYNPSTNLAWAAATNTWAGGLDSVSPSGQACSSFSTYDLILSELTDKTRFPKLKNIVFIGHSGGGNTIQRWSVVASEPSGYHVRYIIANAANVGYFGTSRPVSVSDCPTATEYSYQFKSGTLPPYISARFTSETALFRTWAARDVLTLVGDEDTAANYPGGTDTCADQAQGGANRRERGYAFWAYRNLKAGTSTDVSGYYGYSTLKASVTVLSPKPTFNHQMCVIAGVGHDAEAMYSSNCGQEAIYLKSLTGSVGPLYPS